ncbi:MAG: TolC family protein [Pelobacteraceae bacterium]
MKLFLLTLVACFALAQPLYAAPALTLDEALELALINHPQVIEAVENQRGAEARSGQSRAGYYPQVTIAADWNRGRSFIAAQESIRTTEANSAAVYLKQTIYDFGRTAGTVDTFRAQREAADHALAVTRQDVILRVKSAFYLLLAAEKQVAAVADTVTARSEVLRQAQEFFSQGIRAKVDVARAESNFYAAKTALIRAENNRDIARLELAGAMGVATLGERIPVEPAPVTANLPDRDHALRDATANRGELQQLIAQKTAASATVKTAKSSYLPLLTATANAGYADRDIPPSGNVWGVGVNLTVPLFSGFSSVEQVREATAAFNAVEARQSNLRLQIGKEVESARLGVNEAAARMGSTAQEVVAATLNRELAEGRYHEGVGTVIEATDAQSQALDAQTANIQARYDYYVALARFDRAVGKSEK